MFVGQGLRLGFLSSVRRGGRSSSGPAEDHKLRTPDLLETLAQGADPNNPRDMPGSHSTAGEVYVCAQQACCLEPLTLRIFGARPPEVCVDSPALCITEWDRPLSPFALGCARGFRGVVIPGPSQSAIAWSHSLTEA